MPILNVNIVGNRNEYSNELSKDLADTAGKILKTGPGKTWLKLNYINPNDYAENESSSEINPVFIEIIVKNELSLEEKKKVAKEFSDKFSKYINQPSQNIHTYFLPEGISRMAFGGNLII